MKTAIDEFLSELRRLDVKLWADGDRLRYKAPKETLTPALLAVLRERKAEILAFVHKANAAASSNLPPILPVPKDGNLPLSFAQQRLWFLAQLEPGSYAYNVPAAFRLTGLLNVTALEQSLGEIVRRHSILRTTFQSVDGQPRQVISPDITLTLPVIDLRELPPSQREAEAQRQVTEEAQQPFDLATGPLLRVKLLRLAEEEHVLVLTMHHIVYDGWSYDIFFRELAALYEAFSTGKPSPLPELPIQYADFAHWQREWLQGEVLESELDYWKQQLGGSLPMLQLPTIFTRPAVQTYRGARQYLELPKDLTSGLKALCQRSGVTLFMTLLAAFQTLLYRYSGQDDILVGTPIANRNRVETEGLIGFFDNTLVLRTNLSGNPTFQELLGRVREVALGAYAHQDLPFEKLVEELQPERDLSRNPLFQVMLVLENHPMPGLEFAGLSLSPLKIDLGTAKFDLLLSMGEEVDGLTGTLEYNTDLFDAGTITRMLGHFRAMLEGIVATPEQRLETLPLLTEAERQTLLVEWNNTSRGYAHGQCIHELFEAQVERTPDAIAVAFKDEKLTYRELNCRANQVAHHLQAWGVGPQGLVGICMERSVEMVIGLLGILKAGGAYVPLDPAYPQSRLAFMLEDAQVPVLLTQQRLVAGLPECWAKVVCLDRDWEALARESEENPTSGAKPENLAYAIYTSGSTGRPKGIAMSHYSLCNLISWQLQNPTLVGGARTLQFASLSFDVSFQEIFSTFCSGGTLVMISEELRRDAVKLLRFLTDLRIERLFLPFVALQQLAEVADSQGSVPTSLREIITAGEQLQITQHIVNLFGELKAGTLHNQYGPSESHVVTAFTLTGSPSSWRALPPIGRPISNTQLYLLDGNLQPVPIGVPGELYIGGDGLAWGYLNRPELTAEKFIPNRFSDEPGDRLYKSGDLARYLPDGNIEFLGRIDHQVKIRGFRIELGEIEAVLSQHPAVRQTVVLVREDEPGDKRLVAYVVPHQEPAPTSNELRRFLKEKLPEYMVPSAFMLLSALPLTPNGKVDRRALRSPDQERPALSEGFVAPRSPLEHQLTQIWEELLGIQPIGIQDNFFELGGHSLLAVRMMHRIEQDCGKKLPLSTLFAEATVEHLASVLLKQESKDFQSPLVEVQSGGSKRPFFFLHGDWDGGGLYCLNLARYLGKDQPFYALPPHGFDGEQMLLTIEAMAADHLKTLRAFQPEGPYLLGGFCNGGLVAFEMARQLQAQGQKVDLLVLIDAPPANARFKFLQSFVSWFGYFLAIKLDKQLNGFLLLRYYFMRFPHFSRLRIDKQLTIVLKTVRRGINRVVSMFTHTSGGDQACTSQERPDMRGNLFIWAVDGYVPRLYPGRVTLFLSSEWSVIRRSDDPTLDPTLGWYKMAKEVDVHLVPGEHLTSITKYVQVLAEKLRACLDSAQAAD